MARAMSMATAYRVADHPEWYDDANLEEAYAKLSEALTRDAWLYRAWIEVELKLRQPLPNLT